MSKKLHLVSFDVPYPTNYGGVIDVFYKIKALHQLNVEIYLHVFDYGKGEQPILNQFCKKVFYYKRNKYFKSIIDKNIPFIVKSRGNKALIHNLKSIKAPILFDGLHTTYVLKFDEFKNQDLFLRAHNVEHKFYTGLHQSEQNLIKKRFYKKEAEKLRKYESILKKVKGIFTISPFEQEYFLKNYGDKAVYIPAFHNVPVQEKLSEKGETLLYHGNLLVAENIAAANFLIDTYKGASFKLIIASSFENKKITKAIAKTENIQFVIIESQKHLKQLFEAAHVNVLPTFQKTGIKLKLLNALYQSRFVIANDFMIDDTGLEILVEKANSKEAFLAKTATLFTSDFTEKIQEKRMETLAEIHPTKSAQKIIDIIF